MHSSIISRIEKARTYAEEKERVNITTLNATFRGNHSKYELSLDEDGWHCSCTSFGVRAMCSHTMAVERMLEGMVRAQETPSIS